MGEKMSRIAEPNLLVEQQVHQCGIGLINLFGEDLFKYLDAGLSTSKGKNWLEDLQKISMSNMSANFKDPSTLLKELLDQGNSIFREPLRLVVMQKEAKAFYGRLQIIRDERNDWIHHQIKVDEESLKVLVLNLYPISQILALELITELDFILKKLSPNTEGKADDFEDIEVPTKSLTKNELLNESKIEIGKRFDGALLQNSYSLLLDGNIKDRKSGSILQDFCPKTAKELGALLLSRKPSGGRLRISNEGIIVAYFEDYWGFIAKVEPHEWFTN